MTALKPDPLLVLVAQEQAGVIQAATSTAVARRVNAIAAVDKVTYHGENDAPCATRQPLI